jgi:uncharacterized protein (DUF3820 family)
VYHGMIHRRDEMKGKNIFEAPGYYLLWGWMEDVVPEQELPRVLEWPLSKPACLVKFVKKLNDPDPAASSDVERVAV